MFVSKIIVLLFHILSECLGRDGLLQAAASQVLYWETHLKLALILLGCFIKAIKSLEPEEAEDYTLQR